MYESDLLQMRGRVIGYSSSGQNVSIVVCVREWCEIMGWVDAIHTRNPGP